MKSNLQTALAAPAIRAYETVTREIVKLRFDLAEREAWMAGTKRFAGLAEATRTLAAGAQAQLRAPAPARNGHHAASTRRVGGKAIVGEVETLLAEVGRPMSRTEIVKGLKAKGVKVNGEDPARNIAAVLWRAQEQHKTLVDNLKGHGYWLMDRPCEAVAYEPPTPVPDPALA